LMNVGVKNPPPTNSAAAAEEIQIKNGWNYSYFFVERENPSLLEESFQTYLISERLRNIDEIFKLKDFKANFSAFIRDFLLYFWSILILLNYSENY
jgi:hypothetical protein